MQIIVRDSRLRFEYTSTGKFNVIIGDSGSYKTCFIEYAWKWYKGNRRYTLTAIDDFGNKIRKDNIIICTNTGSFSGDNFAGLLRNKHGALFLVDEESAVLQTNSITKLMLESDNYFVFASRKRLHELPISVDSVFKFKYTKGVVYNVGLYCNRNENLSIIGKSIDFVLTEDMKSSRLFFRDIMLGATICAKEYVIDGVKLYCSNNNLYKILNGLLLTQPNTLLVFDASAFGLYYGAIENLITKVKSLSILAWESFEAYILECRNISVTEGVLGCKYNSVERYATDRLHEIFPTYDKSGIPVEVKDSYQDYIVGQVKQIVDTDREKLYTKFVSYSLSNDEVSVIWKNILKDKNTNVFDRERLFSEYYLKLLVRKDITTYIETNQLQDSSLESSVTAIASRLPREINDSLSEKSDLLKAWVVLQIINGKSFSELKDIWSDIL